MKKYLVMTLILILSTAAFANADRAMETVELKTLVTCQQTDGDTWYEVGVVVDKKGHHKLLLVKHDDDSGRTSLLEGHYANMTENENATVFTSIEDFANFSLSVTTTAKNSVGSFIYMEDGMRKPLKDERMDCYQNSTISYEIEAGLEKRM